MYDLDTICSNFSNGDATAEETACSFGDAGADVQNALGYISHVRQRQFCAIARTLTSILETHDIDFERSEIDSPTLALTIGILKAFRLRSIREPEKTSELVWETILQEILLAHAVVPQAAVMPETELEKFILDEPSIIDNATSIEIALNEYGHEICHVVSSEKNSFIARRDVWSMVLQYPVPDIFRQSHLHDYEIVSYLFEDNPVKLRDFALQDGVQGAAQKYFHRMVAIYGTRRLK